MLFDIFDELAYISENLFKQLYLASRLYRHIVTKEYLSYKWDNLWVQILLANISLCILQTSACLPILTLTVVISMQIGLSKEQNFIKHSELTFIGISTSWLQSDFEKDLETSMTQKYFLFLVSYFILDLLTIFLEILNSSFFPDRQTSFFFLI